jgi:hypothetical protein
MKIFPSKHVVTRDEMPTANPNRTPTDFSNSDYQSRANQSSGYEPAGQIDFKDVPEPKQPGALHLWSEDNTLYREQNGTLWKKTK